MQVTVKTFAQFREIFGRERRVSLTPPATVLDLLIRLGEDSDKGRAALFGEDGRIQKYVIVMRNSVRLSHGSLSGTFLEEGDELAVFPPVAGG